jgi:CubicO group peptidase (beta-lactamase class C family)
MRRAWQEVEALGVDSIFGIASLTKPITATAVMLLVEEGLLGLNRPVQEYLPEFVGAGKELVMVHHLLTHTSGLRMADVDTYLLAKIQAGELRSPPPLPHLGPHEFLHLRCVEAALAAPLSTASGTEMSYANLGYALLAEIVTRVSGQPVEHFVHERILDPLGMTSTSYLGAPPERLPRVVRRAADAPFAAMNDPVAFATTPPGPGPAYSTARDVAAFVQMFLNGGVYGGAQILSPVTVSEMTRDQIPGVSSTWGGEHFPEAGWGYGWGIQGNKKALRDGSLHSPATFSHGGVSMSFAWADPRWDLVGVYLSVLPAERPAQIGPGRHGEWCVDLFANAATAAIVA